jgi:hypothetical protein
MRATSGLCRLFLAIVFGTLLLWSNAARPAEASTEPTQHASGMTSHSLVDLGGHWLVASDGGIFGFGATSYYGSMGGHPLNRPIVGMATTPDGGGYWLVASDGGIFNFGDAGYYGSMGGHPLNRPIVGMAATADGGGYWLVASDGGMFSFGDARFNGSMGGHPLNSPIVGMATTADGGGYWLVASDGGMFSFGDARYHGSMGGRPLNRPIVAMVGTPGGGGYWLVASDGGMFSFGDASYYGSMGGRPLNSPIVGMGASQDGGGYWLAASDGGIFNFGDAGFYGSMGGHPLNSPIVGMASLPQGHGFFASDNCYYRYANGRISSDICASLVPGYPGWLAVYLYPGPGQVPSQLFLLLGFDDPGALYDYRIQPQYDPVFNFIDWVRVPNDATQPYQYGLCESAPSGAPCWLLTRNQIVSDLPQSSLLSTTLDDLYNYDPSLNLPTLIGSTSGGSASSGPTSSGPVNGINLAGIEAGQVTELSELEIGLSANRTSCVYGDCSTLESDGTQIDVLGQNARPASQTPSYPRTPVIPPITSGLPQSSAK